MTPLRDQTRSGATRRATALALLILSTQTPARGQAPDDAREQTHGHVLSIDQGDLIVDIGSQRGATVGDRIELWRVFELRHPVSGKLITDRFSIGELELVQVQDRLSFARLLEPSKRAPEEGDVVILRRARSDIGAASTSTDSPSESSKTTRVSPRYAWDSEAQRVAALFDKLRGVPLDQRILAYERHLAEHPTSRYREALRDQLSVLQRLSHLEAELAEPEQPRVRAFQGPIDLSAGRSFDVGIELEQGVQGAVLLLRKPGRDSYDALAMNASGRFHRVRVPGQFAREPAVEYFIEAVIEDGRAAPVVGDANMPERAQVWAREGGAKLEHESTVHVHTDYADWNRLIGNDVAWQTEGFAAMRFSDVGLRTVQTGFGVYRGVGGSLEELDQAGKTARNVGLTYGAVSSEYGISHFLGLIARGVIGLLDDGVTGGAELLVRLGNDRETNLLIGGEVLGGVGLRGITQLELATFDRVPLLFRTEVTNQPAGVQSSPGHLVRPNDPGALPDQVSYGSSEVGARAIAQVGFRFTEQLMLAGRVSYQGRTIVHAGPGFGAGATYQW